MNIFSPNFIFKYYLKHPILFLREYTRNLRYAWQRITKGYADCDVWNIDNWLMHTLPYMLHDLALDENGVYPGYEPWETPEKWRDYLLSLSGRLVALQDSWAETNNEFEDEHKRISELVRETSADENNYYHTKYNFNLIDKDYYEEIHSNWLSRIEELNREEEEERIKVFSEVGKNLRLFWS